ncbi:MAG TPA: flagellar motor switch protein FliN, partial [Jatrophihabitans sp.]|nr:flagellar motor switch protein FliN [Jatrophihabitans sp.]
AGAAGPRAAVLLGAVAAPEPTPATGAPAGRPPAGRLDLLRGVEMQATVELGRARLTLNDLLGLRDGAVIELDRAAGDAADLSVNGRLIARGEIVVVDENYALRITEIVSGEGA